MSNNTTPTADALFFWTAALIAAGVGYYAYATYIFKPEVFWSDVVEDDGRVATSYPTLKTRSAISVWFKHKKEQGFDAPDFEAFKRDHGKEYRHHPEFLTAIQEYRNQKFKWYERRARWESDYPKRHVARMRHMYAPGISDEESDEEDETT